MILFAASMFCSGYILLFVGLADVFVAGLLSFGVHRLADVVPRTYGTCNKVGIWRSNTDGKNFFVDAYDEGQWEDFSATDLCQSMVRIWACAIAIMYVSSPPTRPSRFALLPLLVLTERQCLVWAVRLHKSADWAFLLQRREKLQTQV
jgi:hypothetical protein